MSRPLWRRLLVPLVATLVVLVVAASVLGVGLTRRAFPQTAGEAELPGLAGQVEVVRDGNGIAHVYADTAEDLFRAQGYVAAQDRFFQMDLRRHIVAGRLAELVGEGGVGTDTVTRTLGWRRVAEQELPLLSADARRYLQAYADGVNAYIDQQGSPSRMGLEYAVLAQSNGGDYTLEPWDEVDSLAWLKAMAWDMRGNYEDELARGRLVGDLPLEQLNSLWPDYPTEEHPAILSPQEWSPEASATPAEAGQSRGGTLGGRTATEGSSDAADLPELLPDAPEAPPAGALTQQWLAAVSGEPVDTTDPVDSAYAATAEALAAVPPVMGRGEGIGSNSWAVSGEHTESGKPLLANDPHLGVSQPGIWLQTGLHCRVVNDACPFDVTGFSFAGFPGVVIGHNQKIAWGFTNLDPDVTDFYLEDVRGDTVLRGEDYVPLDVREEVIKVGGGDDVTITVRESSHGPILSDASEEVADAGTDAALQGVRSSGDYAVALAWTGLEPSTTGEAVFALNSATSFHEFQDAARLFSVPAQNLLYADTEGNIGYQAPGMVPVRRSATLGTPPGFYPAPGWDAAYEWKGWVPFEDLPNAYNPEDGIIVTANQQVTASSTPFLTTEWDKGYRSTRISRLLDRALDDGPLTVAGMQQIQTDSSVSFAGVLVPHLTRLDLGSDFYTEAQDLLRGWDGSAPADGEESAAAAYFYVVYDKLLDALFDDELPADLQVSGNSRSMQVVELLLEDDESAWWDDQRTPGVLETRDEVLRSAMVEARHELTSKLSKDPTEWRWGDLHTVTLDHDVLGTEQVPGVVQRLFNRGPYPAGGTTAAVDAMNWDAASDTFEVTSAPSMRMVVDLADLDRSTWINQTGTSGHPFSEHYDDQTELWLRGEQLPWSFTRGAVDSSAEDTLTLVPAPPAR